MDQYLSTVVIALITGVFSIITIIIQKKQDKVIDKIDEQTLFIEREQTLKQKLTQKQTERESTIHEIMILILDTNLSILKHSETEGGNALKDTGVFEHADELKKKFNSLGTEISAIQHDYDMVMSMNSEYEKANKNKSKES